MAHWRTVPLMRSLALIVVLLAPGVGATALDAQDPVHVEGTVLDEDTGSPIPAVDLVARGPDGRFLVSTVANDSGQFEFDVQYTAGVQLFASRIGYMDNKTPVLYFDGHTFFELEIRLSPEAVLLAPLEVVARRSTERNPILAGYRSRLDTGMGYYITRDEIEQLKPAFVSDLLGMIPGVRLGSSGSGTRRTVTMARTVGHNCRVQIFMDGLLVTERLPTPGGDGVVVDDVVAPESVEGIEVYRGLSTVPAEFLTPEADCGVIAIWTRRGN